jgi:hypothetical protein
MTRATRKLSTVLAVAAVLNSLLANCVLAARSDANGRADSPYRRSMPTSTA